MRRPSILIALVVATLLAVPVLAAGPPAVDRRAAGTEPAIRVAFTGDVVRVYNLGPLRDDVATRAFAAARQAGGTAAITRSASIGMRRIRRGAATVQAAPPGWAYPMGTSVLPPEAVGPLIGYEVSAALTSFDLVMGRRTADLRGAQDGDSIDLVATDGSTVVFVIRSVVDDDVLGGTELMLSPDGADRLGLDRLSSVVIWGFDSRADVDRQLTLQGLVDTSIRIRRGWDPPDPDSTLGMARTKELLGEFAYRVDPASGAVSVDSTWKDASISKAGPIGQLTLRSGCHVVARAALQPAMDEVIASGLEDTINYFHANTAGGCFVPRFSRISPDSSIGFLSRHTWGMAIDTNTVGSCQGCAPPDMDCRTVRIFRKHGFAWGGNFLLPDGMHFEWVGEPRDTLLYPSRFCPNIVAEELGRSEGPTGPSPTAPTSTQRATLFADDGLISE